MLFNPLELLANNYSDSHELLISTGYGYKTYTRVFSSKYIIDENEEKQSFMFKSNGGFEPYYGKIMYNYHFEDNLFAGIVAGFDGYDGEAELLVGGQYGVDF